MKILAIAIITAALVIPTALLVGAMWGEGGMSESFARKFGRTFGALLFVLLVGGLLAPVWAR